MVRVGPNHVSLSNPEHVPTIYGIATKYYKVSASLTNTIHAFWVNRKQSNFYSMFDVKTQTGQVVPTVFSVRDEAYHKALKRPVADAYFTSTLKGFESLVDDCIRIFEEKLDKYEGTDLDFGKWLHWFAFDVIRSITFSNRQSLLRARVCRVKIV